MNAFANMSGFAGRLNRKPYWIASIVLAIIMVAAFAVITWVGASTFDLALVNILSTIVLVVVLYPVAALMVKRLHDRDKNGNWALLLIVPALILAVTNLLGFTGKPPPLPNPEDFDLEAGYFSLWGQSLAYQARMQPIDFAFNVWFFIVGLWFTIELGFLRGTRGPNRYGPDPLEGSRSGG